MFARCHVEVQLKLVWCQRKQVWIPEEGLLLVATSQQSAEGNVQHWPENHNDGVRIESQEVSMPMFRLTMVTRLDKNKVTEHTAPHLQQQMKLFPPNSIDL